jgi:hypothetical protein
MDPMIMSMGFLIMKMSKRPQVLGRKYILKAPWYEDNDTQHNDIQHNDSEHNDITLYDTQHKNK